MTNYSTIGMAVEYVLQWQEAKYGFCMTWNQACAGVTNWCVCITLRCEVLSRVL